MQDIRIDDAGNFRCYNCGGKNFSEKRTRRAKVIGVAGGVATLGVAGAAAPLVAKKRLWCQACGEYNKMGDAKPFKEAARDKVVPKKPQSKASEDTNAFLGVLLIVVVVFVVSIAVITNHAWWWLIVLIPAWLLLAAAGAGFVVERLGPKKKSKTTSRNEAKPVVDVDSGPRVAGWYPDRSNPALERRWSGTAWTSQTRPLEAAD